MTVVGWCCAQAEANVWNPLGSSIFWLSSVVYWLLTNTLIPIHAWHWTEPSAWQWTSKEVTPQDPLRWPWWQMKHTLPLPKWHMTWPSFMMFTERKCCCTKLEIEYDSMDRISLQVVWWRSLVINGLVHTQSKRSSCGMPICSNCPHSYSPSLGHPTKTLQCQQHCRMHLKGSAPTHDGVKEYKV